MKRFKLQRPNLQWFGLQRFSIQHLNLFLLVALLGHSLYVSTQMRSIKEHAVATDQEVQEVYEVAISAANNAYRAADGMNQVYDVASEARDYAAEAASNAYFTHCRYCAD